MKILGISAYYHDSAAALVEEGRLVSAAQEERFTRRKHDASFPLNAIAYCLDERSLSLDGVDAVVFYEKPLLTFERLLETYLAFAPRGFRSFARAMPVWLKEKLYLKQVLKKQLAELAEDRAPPLFFSHHHQSHAASAFFPGPFREAAVLCMDGVGEWATTSAWLGRDRSLQPLWEIDFPHSLGLLYSAVTYFCGFRVNSGEYKLMGLAPYGEPRYADLMREKLLDIKPDGTFRLDLDYFDYCTGLRMTNDRFAALFGGPPREPETEITQREMDMAASVQAVTEDIVMRLATTLRNETGQENLCLSGGVALNCVANGLLQRSGLFKSIWIQPAAGDAGGAAGAALAYWNESSSAERPLDQSRDGMQGAYLGPVYDEAQVAADLERLGAVSEEWPFESLVERVAALIDEGKVIGWFQGRMEFGPRALGNRSILGDPVWVTSVHGRYPEQAPVVGETMTKTVLEYPDGVQALVATNHYNEHGTPYAEFRILGTEGTLQGTIGLMYDYPNGRPDTLSLFRDGEEVQAFELDTMWLPDAFLGPMSDLMDAVATGREPATLGRKMLATLAIGEAAYRSAEERRSVRLTEITGLVP